MTRLYDRLPLFGQNFACTLAGYWLARRRFTDFFHSTLGAWEENVDLPPLRVHEAWRTGAGAAARQQLSQLQQCIGKLLVLRRCQHLTDEQGVGGRLEQARVP